MGKLWKKDMSLQDINLFVGKSMVGHLGIEFIEKGQNFLKATMPVDKRTKQPLGILHGGASVVLAESLGSMASHMTMEDNHYSVGLEIKANHIKSVGNGMVTGKTTPVHLGKTIQIWNIDVKNEKGELVCSSRLTMMILKDLPA